MAQIRKLKSNMPKFFTDEKGRYHTFLADCIKANREYREETERPAAAAEELNRLLKKAALAQTEATRKQFQLLEEQNRLLMMTPEERSAYKKKLEEDERQKLVASLGFRPRHLR